MTGPIETLKHEHQIVLLVLRGAERAAQTLQSTGKIPFEDVDKMIDFFRTFVDRCHHAKEEKHLFVRMQERGMSRESGPIAVMLYEHEEGRRLVRAMAEALGLARKGGAHAAGTVRKSLSDYVNLLRAHIDKEDNVLYVMANRILTSEDQQELTKAFDKLETEEMGEGVHEKYHQLAHDLGK